MDNQNITEQIKPAQNKMYIWLTFIIILVIIVIFGVGVYVWQKRSPLSTEQPLQQLDQTESWKTYVNLDLGFQLDIPSFVSVDREFNDEYNRLVIFKSDNINFQVRIREGKALSLENYYYLDFPVSSKSTLGGKEASVFEAPNGYCDGPSCGYPFVAYSTKYGNDFYNLVFTGDIEISDTEKSILSSFKFTK